MENGKADEESQSEQEKGETGQSTSNEVASQFL